MTPEQYLERLARQPRKRAKADGGIVDPLIKILNQIPGCFAIRVNSGRVRLADGYWMHLGPIGFPDVMGAIQGVPYTIECKSEAGVLKPRQRARQAALRACGVETATVRTIGDGVVFVRGLVR